MIYFDAAATTLDKPYQVRRAVWNAVNAMASPGRGSSAATQLAENAAFACREEAAALFGVGQPENVVFTANATHGLNIAIRTLAKPGCRVLISGYEHNAVTRTLHAVEGLEVVVIDTPLFAPDAMAERFERELQYGADLVICNHVSNVFGYVLPLKRIADACRKACVPLIVDASQSAGIMPVRMDELDAAFIAMPGHKGLYGPQGTGLLLCRTKAEPLLLGGTGSASLEQDMPDDLPDRLEAGTHNMPGIAGLLEGIRFVRRMGTDAIRAHEQSLCAYAVQRLRALPEVRVYAAEQPSCQVGVVSFAVDGRDCEEISEALARRGIAVRAGFHCAPLAHRTGGTLKTGTIRISFSYFNRPEQVDIFILALQRILREKVTF